MEVLFNDKTAVSRAGKGSAAGVVGAGSPAGVVGAGSATGSCSYLNYISAAFYYMLLSKSSICWFCAQTNAAIRSCLKNIKLNK